MISLFGILVTNRSLTTRVRFGLNTNSTDFGIAPQRGSTEIEIYQKVDVKISNVEEKKRQKRSRSRKSGY